MIRPKQSDVMEVTFLNFKDTVMFITFDITRKGNLIRIDNIYKDGSQLVNTKIKKESTTQINGSLRIDETRQDLYEFIIDVFKSQKKIKVQRIKGRKILSQGWLNLSPTYLTFRLYFSLSFWD